MKSRKAKKKPTAKDMAPPQSSVGVTAIVMCNWTEHILVAVHLWLPPTPCRRKIAQEENNRPDLLIAQRPLRSRHARGKDAVIDNPLQLPIRVSLHLSRGQ